MTEQIELLPCPFCGGAPNKEPEDNGIGCYWIICDNVSDGCGCEGPYKHSKEEAAHAWNRRAAPVSAAQPPAGIEGFGATYIRNDDHWVIYTMPGCVPFGTVKGYDRKRLDWMISILRTGLPLTIDT